jgi:hypothetical protein
MREEMKMKMMRWMSLAAFVAVMVAGCAQNRLLRDGEIPSILEAQSDSRFIRVLGIGACPPNTRGETLQKALARNAALAGARWELAALLRGVRLSGEQTIEKAIHRDGQIKEIMNQLIAGAVEKRVEFTRDNGAIVLLEIERSTVKKILDDIADREAAQVNPGSLERQIKASEARLIALRARLPGVDE